MKLNKPTFHYHLMLLPGMLILVLFSIIPLCGSFIMAFQNFKPGLGIWRSGWAGLENFYYMFQFSDSRIIFYNTVLIALLKIAGNLLVPLAFALMLNELRIRYVKRSVQTLVYLPHFLSWVILAGIITDLLSLNGPINQLAHTIFGVEPTLFLGSNAWFPAVIVISDVWKEFGFNTIIYLAALTAINPTLYEAAKVDGASRFRRLWHVTLPSIVTTVILIATLSLGNVLNAGFDQIYNLYNPLVYQSGDIIDTYVYRTGLVEAQYGLATAVGLMKSIISFVLIVVSYKLAERFANYRIF